MDAFTKNHYQQKKFMHAKINPFSVSKFSLTFPILSLTLDQFKIFFEFSTFLLNLSCAQNNGFVSAQVGFQPKWDFIGKILLGPNIVPFLHFVPK